MKLHNPVDKFVPKDYPLGDVSQWFGENPQLYSKSVCTLHGCLKGHNGIDIVRPYGTAILAVSRGKVVEWKQEDTGYGRQIRILDDENREWVYGHASKLLVNLGQKVSRGEPVIKMGNSGFVVSGATPYWKHNPYAGTHLHLGYRRFKPWSGMGSWTVTYPTGDKGDILDHGNGYLGSVELKAEDFEGYVPAPQPSYLFKRNLEFGMRNDQDVKELQGILKFEGVLSQSIPSTGNYLEETRKAVLAYQKKYGLVTPLQELMYRGKFVHDITRGHLNSKYSVL